MKFRTLVLIIFILLVAGFVALNFEAILTPTTLNFAVTEVQAPLGLVLLGMLALVLVVFLLALGVLPDPAPDGGTAHHARSG
jgi:hypothetical protein